MKNNFLISKIWLLLLLAVNISHAQNPRVWASETEIEFELETEKRLNHSFEFATRSLLSEHLKDEKLSGYEHQHIELTYLSVLKISEQSTFSFGARYRFSTLFNYRDYNELRIIPKYEYEQENGLYVWEHEARLEQRFKGKEYAIRPRYELGLAREISNIFTAKASTSSLWSVSPQSKPEFEQRFALEFENYSLKNIELVLGFEYRMEDYTNALTHEFFILSGATIQL